MADPVFPERPDWLTEVEWQQKLDRVRALHEWDRTSDSPGIRTLETRPRLGALSPEDVWWEAWQIAVIQDGHKVAPPPRPEAQRKPVSDAIAYRTGAPGRPGSRHLVENEIKDRIERGNVEKTLSAQAKVLSEWLRGAHPGAAPMGKAAIENAVREIWKTRPIK